MNEKKWFLMEHEEYGTRAAYVILSEDGAVVMNDCYNGFDEEARRNIQNFMQQQVAKEQEQQRQQQVQSQMQSNQTQQPSEQQKKNQSWQTGRRSWTTENIFAVRRWQKKLITI